MRRVAAAKFGKRQPESNWASPSVPPGRRRLHRAGFRPPPRAPQSRLRILSGAENQVQPAWDVVDDFQEDIPVMPRELKVIETYLAAVLDESLEPTSLEAAIESVKPDVE